MEKSSRARSTALFVRVVDRARVFDIQVNGRTIPAAELRRLLDNARIPDGTPYLTDSAGHFHTLRSVNAYLLDAARQRAYPMRTLRNNHAGALVGLLNFIRETSPNADLVDTTTEHLNQYKERRLQTLAGSSWNTEVSDIGLFFAYARDKGWLQTDPVPRWGTRQRNTLKSPEKETRRIRFLTEEQLAFFLNHGLRGDDVPDDRPEYPERDYTFGLTLVSTGLRREEATYLLDLDIPTNLPRGSHIFERIGKGSKPRDVHIIDHLADVIDHYRRGEREYMVERAQPTLRSRRRNGTLTVAELVPTTNGTALRIGARLIRPNRLPNSLRRTAVWIRDDGLIDPLALFLAEGGQAPAIDRFNRLFSDANHRVASFGPHEHAPPAHITVAPHILRHTFAVRTLAALMREGRQTQGDPYALLASPLLVVQELLGHTSLSTTNRYLYHAETYTDQVPNALRESLVKLVRGL
ncbi:MULTISPECIES: tyrosine-type recombinase/integrase [unclassified Microbacterium]|uniref:tyrosine-type recombinase/integrase n=1 Tax=unclassified Microbacterium TaxID=2609290 RepID=UPI001443CC1B|nr:tyrosine-type recombinase/integrase [Microbacterium sp. K41]